jgi:hypothetical protein
MCGRLRNLITAYLSSPRRRGSNFINGVNWLLDPRFRGDDIRGVALAGYCETSRSPITEPISVAMKNIRPSVSGSL